MDKTYQAMVRCGIVDFLLKEMKEDPTITKEVFEGFFALACSDNETLEDTFLSECHKNGIDTLWNELLYKVRNDEF